MKQLAWVVVAACGSSNTPHPDAYPTAEHAAYPQLPDHGGPRLLHPQLTTVTFANDPRAAQLEAFAQYLVSSSWLTAVGDEYGVGAGGITGVAHRPETPVAQITNADIESYLAAGITDGSIPRPEALADALFIIYYPQTTTITTTFVNNIMLQSCSSFTAYHGEAHAMGLDFSYAAIPSCGGETMDITEGAVSHEVIEAATDAFPISSPAYQLTPDPTDVWFQNFRFEVEDGDLCEAPDRSITDSGYTLQRTYSNKAAAAGGDPCVPNGATPAFGTSGPTTPLILPAGGSADLPLVGWSTGDVADWNLAVQPWISDGTALTRARISLSAATLDNGGAATAHITLPANAHSGNFSRFLLVSQHTPEDAAMWPIVVQVQ